MTNIANNEGDVHVYMSAYHRINGARHSSCTNQLKSYVQMKVDGNWKTIIGSGASFSYYSTAA